MPMIAHLMNDVSFVAGWVAVWALIAVLLVCAVMGFVFIWKELISAKEDEKDAAQRAD